MNINTDGGIAIEEETETTVSNYPMWKVIMHNDPLTTMGFVVMILEKLYGKKADEALKIMREIHEKGSGLAGVYIKEHAEMRVAQTHDLARANGFPLTCSLEKA